MMGGKLAMMGLGCMVNIGFGKQRLGQLSLGLLGYSVERGLVVRLMG